ncbi:insulinase family protein [Candidatus Parcubacteria bacterium]|nr:insulinase family protein [Candidatus Parcubacteria bacterium]
MDKKIFTLPNGLRVLVIENNQVETVALNLVGQAGTMFEKADQIGVAHFLEHVVFDATRDYPDENSLTGLVEDVGGVRGGLTNKEIVEYWIKILPEHIERAFMYLSQITLYPMLKEKDIEKHKGIIEQEIGRIKADPEKYAMPASYTILYPNQSIGGLTTGDVQDIKTIDRHTLESFLHDRYYAQNFILVVCGKCDVATIQALAGKYFSDMKSGTSLSVKLQPNYDKDLFIERRPGLKQTALQINYHGFRQDDKKSAAAEFISALFSRGKLSRLNKRIRDELSLAYVIRAQHYTGLRYGLFNIYSGLAEKNIPIYLQAIHDECEKIIDYDIKQDEWQKTLALLETSFKYSFEEMLTMGRFYARTHADRSEIRDHGEIIKAYKSLTQEDIRTTARELFSQEPKITVIGEKIPPELFEH